MWHNGNIIVAKLEDCRRLRIAPVSEDVALENYFVNTVVGRHLGMLHSPFEP